MENNIQVRIPLEKCPVCGKKPIEMLFKFSNKKRPKEYSYICADHKDDSINTGHWDYLADAYKAWNVIVSHWRA